MIPNKRRIEGLIFRENDTTEVRLPKGYLEEGLIISGSGTATLSAAATSVRLRGTPIKSISLVGDGGKVLHAVRPQTLIKEQEVYEQVALANLVVPPAAFGIAAHTFTFDLPLMFKSSHALDGMMTALPSWIFDELTLRVEWGDFRQLFVPGAGAGVVTMQSLAVVAAGVQEDFRALGDPQVWGRNLGRLVRSFREQAAPNAVTSETVIELPRTADIRAIFLETEDVNGEPVETIVGDVTLEIDNNLRQYNRVPSRVIRADNAKLFGVRMPPGMAAILEFAEDKDITQILEAPSFTALNLIVSTAAVVGTIRTTFLRIESGR